MAKIGSPIMTCDRNSHVKTDKHGNYEVFLKEAFASKETGLRRCWDADYNKDKTKDNIMLGDFSYVEDILSFLDERAGSYRVRTKKGVEKKLRSDAKLCVCGVLKVDSSYVDNLPLQDQIRLYTDAYEILQQETPRLFGFEYIAGVIQMDERSVHLHTVGFDSDFQLSHKADIRYKRWLNFTFPELLADRGWDIQPNDRHYDPEYAKTLEGQELEDYLDLCKEEKKSRLHGMDSKSYKAMKELEGVNEEIQVAARARNRLINDNNRLQAKNTTLKTENADLRLLQNQLLMQNDAVESGLDQKLAEYEKYSNLADQAKEVYDNEIQQVLTAYSDKAAKAAASEIAAGLERKGLVPVKALPRRLKAVVARGNEQILDGTEQGKDYRNDDRFSLP